MFSATVSREANAFDGVSWRPLCDGIHGCSRVYNLFACKHGSDLGLQHGHCKCRPRICVLRTASHRWFPGTYLLPLPHRVECGIPIHEQDRSLANVLINSDCNVIFAWMVQLVCLGLLAEVCVRTYFESQPRPAYRIREVATSATRWRFKKLEVLPTHTIHWQGTCIEYALELILSFFPICFACINLSVHIHEA